MALTEEDVSSVISALARATLEPAGWLPALSIMNKAVGATSCALEFADLNTGLASMECDFQLDRNVLQDYEERIFHINPRVRRAQKASVGRVVDDRHLFPPDDPHSPEFLDWLARTPNRYMQGAKLLDEGGHQVYYGSHFSHSHGPPEPWQEKFHEHVIPHLVNFVAAGRILSGGTLRNQLLGMDSFEADRPFALLNRAGRLVECSRGFEAMLQCRHMLGVREGRLIAVHARHRHSVDSFLNRALGQGRMLERPMPIRLVAPDHPRGIVLRAVPISSNGDIFDIFRPVALIVLTDLDQPLRVRRHELMVVFGLTEREADVAALISEGKSVEGIAVGLAISAYTVRQHLKVVFAKVGVARQAELVAIVMKLA